MLRLASTQYSIIGTSCAGAGVIAALSMGANTWQPIVGVAVAGAVIGLPVTWYVTKQVLANKI